MAAEIWGEINDLNTDSSHILRSLIYYLLVRLNQDYIKMHETSPDTITDIQIMRL
ncbi:MAG: hypothetical protein PF489_12115 [Salinivirgaceae bacterium]|nr:hypothetical protein [Salinivirgaceae bacterium]